MNTPLSSLRLGLSKVLAVILTPFIAFGCAHSRTARFESALKTGRCDEALQNIPENHESIKFLNKTQHIAGTAMSYAVTGGGYTADVVIVVGGVGLILVALCAPALLAHGGQCLPWPATGTTSSSSKSKDSNSVLEGPNLGGKVFKATADWRCPDVSPLAKSFRRVAECQAHQGQEGSAIAVRTLGLVRNDPGFWGCMKPSERQEFLTMMESYRAAH